MAAPMGARWRPLGQNGSQLVIVSDEQPERLREVVGLNGRRAPGWRRPGAYPYARGRNAGAPARRTQGPGGAHSKTSPSTNVFGCAIPAPQATKWSPGGNPLGQVSKAIEDGLG